jgi:hypothetical protein
LILNFIMKYYPICLILLVACGGKVKNRHNISVPDNDTVKYAKYPRIAKENNIKVLVDRIDKSDCVYSGRVGYTLEESEIYDCFQRLLEIAPDSIWVQLSFHRNPVIRIYAFEALSTKKSSYFQAVKERLQKDTASFCYVAADIRTTYSIGSFVAVAKL